MYQDEEFDVQTVGISSRREIAAVAALSVESTIRKLMMGM